MVDRRPEVPPTWARLSRRPARAVLGGAVVGDARGRARLRAIDVVDATGASAAVAPTCWPWRAAGTRPCSRPPISAASRVWDDELAAFVPGRTAAGHERRGRGGGDVRRWRSACADGAAARREAAADCGFTAGSASPRRAPTTSRPRSRRCGMSRRAAQGVRRFPERRHRQGHRARRARGLRFGRASQALHHARHGDRPGQDLQRHRPRDHGRTDRPHDRRRPAPRCPGRPTRRSAIGAFAGHHRGKDFRPTRLHAGHDWATEQGAVFVESRRMAARAMVPARRRDRLAAERSTAK